MSVFTKKTNTNPSHSSSHHDKGKESFFGVQAKLSIGKSNDKFEVEADRVADQVVAKKQTATTDTFFSPSPVVQKKLAEEVQKQDEQNKEIQQKTVAETITPVVQLKEETIQNKLDAKKPEKRELNEAFSSPKTLLQNKLEERVQKKEESIQNKAEVKKTETVVTNTAPLKPIIQNKAEEEVQKKDEKLKDDKKVEVQQKSSEETVTPVTQPKTEVIQNTVDTAKKESAKTNASSLKPIIQNKTEEEVQKKDEKSKDDKKVEVQQKSSEETVTPVAQPKAEVTPIKIEAPKAENTKIAVAPKPIAIQKKPEEEVQQKKEEETQTKEDEKQLQMSAAGDANPSDSSNLESNLNSSKGGGSPLSGNTKKEMESGFGTDFSNVKIHTDSNAVQMNKQLGSQAFATGNNVYFNEGKYNPNSTSGKHLLAHELTHTVQQGATTVRKKPDVTPAPETIQTSLLSFAVPGFIKDNVRHIPGYTLLTVVAGYDPLNDVNVERNAINLIEGFMGLIPFGTAIFDKLQEYGIIDRVFEWVNTRLSELGLSMDALLKLVQDAWTEASVTTFIDVVRTKFNEVVARVTSFATSLVDQILTWIKEALIEVAEPLLAENKAYDLIKKIIKYDPLRDKEVSATTVEILEDFLKLIGKETELEQMREKGTLQETADWMDTQVVTFMSLLGELGGLIDDAWNAIQPSNLANIADNLSALATRAGGFLERVWDFAVGVALKVLELVKKSLLGWLSSQAGAVRGYSLIKVIIGKDPFTQEVLPRTVPNLIRGFMSLMEGGEEQYTQMVESGAIARIVGEIEAAVATLNMTPESIVQLFTDIWDSMSIDDLIHPLDAFVRIIEKFGEPIGRLIAFVAEIIRIIIIAILEIMNFPFDLIGNIITRALEAIEDIKKDPIGFLKNILRALKQGFIQFFDNIVTHLISGVTGWLMSELRDANIPVLTDFSLRGVIAWVLEVLNISMERIWEKLDAHPRIGPERVARIRGMINTLEGIWTFIRDVQERGMAAIWDKIQEQLSNLWNTVLDAVKNFVMEQIVNRITARLLSMLDPTGIMAVINGAMAFFNAVQSFIRYLREMLEVVNSFVNGVADLARGNVGPAANHLESTMGRAMPVMIGFLANQVGLSGIGRRVGEMIVAVREMVDEALTWLVNQAVDRGMALLDRLMAMGASARDAILGWLGLRKEFDDTNGGHHSIYFQGSGANAQLNVASYNPRTVRTLLVAVSEVINLPENIAHQQSYNQALALNNEIDLIKTRINNASNPNPNQDNVTMNEKLTLLATKLPPLMTLVGGTEPPPLIKPSFTNGVKSSSFEVNFLKSGRTSGGTPANRNDGTSLIGWRKIDQYSLQNNSAWVKMHLLTEQLGGPALDSNLTPARGPETNTPAFNQVERQAIAAVTSGKTIWYKIFISYHGSPNEDYANKITIEFGPYKYNSDTNEWEKRDRGTTIDGSSVGTIFDQTPDLPNFSGVPQIISLNNLESGRVRLQGLAPNLTRPFAVFLQTVCNNKVVNFVNENDLEMKLITAHNLRTVKIENFTNQLASLKAKYNITYTL